MPRLHLFELEDQPWLPIEVRAYSTDCLRLVFSALVGRSRIAERLRRVLEHSNESRLLDLCSGSSGPLEPVLEALAEDGLEVEALLTDLHPHPDLAEGLGNRLTYHSEPIDARLVPRELPGVRTCFAGLHHFRPLEATQVLAAAVAQRRGLAIFEPASRRFADFLSVPLIGLLSLVATPFLRPFRWSRLFWTYLVPLVPLVVVWDGWVSCARCYTAQELLALAHQALDSTNAHGDYCFEVGRDQLRGLPVAVTWLTGHCVASPDSPP